MSRLKRKKYMVCETRTIAEREISNKEQGILNEEVFATETRRQKDNYQILIPIIKSSNLPIIKLPHPLNIEQGTRNTE